MIALLVLTTAMAAVPYDSQKLQQKLKETQSYRQQRLSKYAPNLPSSAYQKAAQGKVATGLEAVAGHKAQKGWGVAIFDVPIDRLWGGVNDELNHVGLTPVDHTEIIKGAPCSDQRKVMMSLPVPILSDRWWIVQSSTNPQLIQQSNGAVRELSWNHVPDAAAETLSPAGKARITDAVNVSFSRGAWLLIALDENHTLGEYYTWADPGGNIPAGPASTFAAGGIEQTFNAMQDYARKHKKNQCMTGK